MTDFWILGEDGEPKPTDLMTWAVWFRDVDRHVADERIGDVRVSTVFIGLDHNFGRLGPPILWESMVFGGPLDGEMARYTTREDARAGHARLVGRVRAAGA